MHRLLKNYINGQWTEATKSGDIEVDNPITGEILCRVPLSTREEINRAIIAAHNAFSGWSKTPVSVRISYAFKLRESLSQEFDNLSRLIVTEMGKSLSDAEAEMKRCIQNIEMACGMPHLIKGYKTPNVVSEIDVETIRLPIGVFGIVSPFNFPVMVPFWFLPYAIFAGNTVVMKPSEQVPLCMEYVFNIIDKLKLPPGVINLVNGNSVVVDALLESNIVKGISFVGSSKVAQKIYLECAKTNKRCQAMGSAKNYLVVMSDADFTQAIPNIITSCFGCAGQRCMAASVIACVGEDTYELTKDKFIDAAKRIDIGNPLDPKFKNSRFVMGPVISGKARKRIIESIEMAAEDGAILLLDGREVAGKYPKGYFIGPTILGNVRLGSRTERTEIFGPVVSMIKVDSIEDAIKAINDNPYGNGASIYTKSGYYARKFEMEANCGMIGINIGVPAPVAYFPFGGTKASQLSDIKAQGTRVIDFFTEEKIITRRFPG